MECNEEPCLADGRYALQMRVGEGASGMTYRARRRSDNATVCIKELRYRQMGSFDTERHFRREAAVLRQIIALRRARLY